MTWVVMLYTYSSWRPGELHGLPGVSVEPQKGISLRALCAVGGCSRLHTAVYESGHLHWSSCKKTFSVLNFEDKTEDFL